MLPLGLGKGSALALDGVQHNAGGHALLGIGVLDGLIDGLHVVAVDLLGVQAEARRLSGDVAVVENISGLAVQLVAVVVDDVDEVVQLAGVGEVESLPHLALVGLAVAHHAEYMVGAAVDLVTQGRARGGGSPLAQRAGGQIHAGSQLAVSVAGELGVGLVQGVGLLHGIEAHETEGGISHGSGVALTEHQPVAILPAGVLGIELHDLTVQNGHQVC